MNAGRPRPRQAAAGPLVIEDEASPTVSLRGEEYHQETLRHHAPPAGCRPRPVDVELVFAPIARGPHAGRPGVEARLGGLRVGELPPVEAEAFRPLIEETLDRGLRPEFPGHVVVGGFGMIEVELDPPEPDELTALVSSPAFGRPPGPTRMGTGRPLAGVPHPTARPAGPDRIESSRSPVWMGLGALALAALIGVPFLLSAPDSGPPPGVIVGNTMPVGADAWTTDDPIPTPAAIPMEPTTEPAAVAPEPVAEPVAPRTRRVPTRLPVVVVPPPAPVAAPTATPIPPTCEANYSGGCVPIATDVDCADGSGDGPAYVTGPIYVVGTDIYGLDRDGNGTACEPVLIGPARPSRFPRSAQRNPSYRRYRRRPRNRRRHPPPRRPNPAARRPWPALPPVSPDVAAAATPR